MSSGSVSPAGPRSTRWARWESGVGSRLTSKIRAPALAEGVRVVHNVYGHGTVLDVQGQGFQRKVRVRFEAGGDKLLVLEHAGLRIVPTGRTP